MKSFSLTVDQITSIACALTSDELARNFSTYTDYLTLAEWGADTRIGDGGLELTAEQARAAAARLTNFFDKPSEALVLETADTFGDWARRIAPEIERELSSFRFHASVQTGNVEACHAADEVWQDARVVAGLLHGRRRVITMVPPHGLVAFVTSVLAPNLQHLDVLDARAMSPEKLSEELAFGDLVISTPTLWRYLVRTLSGFPNNVMGVSFSEPLLPDLARELREKGLGAMREVYGTTETGVIGWRDTPSESFVLFDHWLYKDGLLTRICPDGQERQMSPMDAMDWEGERAFSLAGRLDGAIQVGTVNVFPRKISEVIAGHPDIEKCSISVTKQHGTLDRLIAHIKLEAGLKPDTDMAWKVDSWCRDHLRPPERPRIFVFNGDGSELDLSGS